MLPGFDDLENATRAQRLEAAFTAMCDPAMRERHRLAVEAVVRWQAAKPDSRLGRPEPFDQEQYGKGIRLLDAVPADPTVPYEQYGYDEKGVLRVARLPVTDHDDRLERMREQSFHAVPAGTFVYDQAWMEDLGLPDPRYVEAGDGASLSREVDGRIIELLDLRGPEAGEAYVSEYRWVDGRPVEMRTREACRASDGTWQETDAFRVRGEYDEHGLTRLVESSGKAERIWWKRHSGREVSHATLARSWKKALTRAVPSLVEIENAERRPIHAVALLYWGAEPFGADIVVLWARPTSPRGQARTSRSGIPRTPSRPISRP